MLSSMLKEHQLKQISKREEIEQKRNAAIASSIKFTSQMVHHLNEGVSQTYLNQRKLDNESKQLYQNIEHLSRQTNQWLILMNNFNDSLKQLGDVENWSKCIEIDMREISSILEYVSSNSNKTPPTQPKTN
ncbi:biogenesis of lysosome-related organelles complex 1 subunit 1 [Dermatophagoides pteronyssinus]|uniref:Biogenesis of lysosome-related organelles complex 1 subunit 1 n=2 Tax=Dermatophagoides pteronyssinus TaxID=6956 RepID=A0A6P6YA89_DERPT|nr:biogenesis of lysosome-related organelles complex 1 subunit 1-like [Dermatophagoides pteronyssinus]KAH9417045.1 biogenesis of lysosome- organelles complex 1 subunit 1 [Dermatophagoides pteronyssinus]